MIFLIIISLLLCVMVAILMALLRFRTTVKSRIVEQTDDDVLSSQLRRTRVQYWLITALVAGQSFCIAYLAWSVMGLLTGNQ